MHYGLRKHLFWAVSAGLCFASLLRAQDSAQAQAIADSAVSSDSVPAAVLSADSVSSPDSSAAQIQAPSPKEVKPPSDSLKPPAAPAKEQPKPKPKPTGDRVEARVIPWDWDQYTNVVEAGLRDFSGREYSLEKNEHYDSLFTRLGKAVRVWGKVSRDSEGFYSMAVNFDPEEIIGEELAALTLRFAPKTKDKSGSTAELPIAKPVLEIAIPPETAADKPHIKMLVPPVYPEDAESENIEGKVDLSLHVTEEGAVDSVVTAISSGHQSIDDAAVRAAEKTLFYPAIKDGKPVSMWIEYPFHFDMNKKDSIPENLGSLETVYALHKELADSLAEMSAGNPDTVPANEEVPEAEEFQVEAEVMPKVKYMPPKPKMPPHIAKDRVEVVTRIEFFVTKTGDVDPDRTKIAISSGYPELDSIAVEWAKGFKFDPALNRGEPVSIRMAIPIEWKSE
ncbi:MAG TPA: TonB family protein [archaeon]|nr:TonB family protein [archaeon]